MNSSPATDQHPPRSRQKPAVRRVLLLLAGLFLATQSLLVTHAFGDVAHAVQDDCQICQHFDRHAKLLDSQSAPVSEAACFTPQKPSPELHAARPATLPYQGRAPPLA